MGQWRIGLSFAVFVVACGGQSLDDESTGGAAGSGDSGKSGAPGSGGTTAGSGSGNAPGSGGTGAVGGSGARGGTTSAGGTTSTGGTGARGGTTSTGGSAGSNRGGSSGTGNPGVGGSLGGIAGQAGTGTQAGAAGAGSACNQPLVSGNCNAAFQRYGFNTTSRHCERFPYGGCGANDNNFETLAECEAACGGSAEGGCPATQPDAASACEESPSPCHYAQNGCSCAAQITFCPQVDPQCVGPLARAAPPADAAPCVGPDCPSPIVVPTPVECTCTASGWACVL